MGMDQELFKLRSIIGHQGPLAASDPDWKDSKYNGKWNGRLQRSLMNSSLSLLLDDPVTYAPYAK